MTKEQKEQQAESTINMYTGFATAAAIIPLPVADVVTISGAQISMIVHLGKIFGKPINRHFAKGIIGVYAAGHAGMWAASLVKAVPFFGTIFGGALQAAIAGTITYSLGKAVKYMLVSDKELTKEAIAEEMKNQDKDELNRKKAEIKQQLAKTKEAQQQINFQASPPEFEHDVTFQFNLDGYANASLRITDLEGEEITAQELDTTRKQFNWNANGLQEGDYPVYLQVEGLLPIGITIKKI